MNSENIINLPLMALRGVVIFPEQLLHFDVIRKKSVESLQRAMGENRKIILVSQKDLTCEDPGKDDLYKIGVIAEVQQIIRIPNKKGIIHVSVKGLKRVKLITFTDDGKALYGGVKELRKRNVKKEDEFFAEALIRRTKDEFVNYADFAPEMPVDIVTNILSIKEPGALADYIAGNIMIEYQDKQTVLEVLDPIERLNDLCFVLARESKLLALESQIGEKVQERMDKNQKEYYLSEQIKVISEELNGFSQEDDLTEYVSKIESMEASEDIKQKLRKECSRLQKMSPSSPDATVARTYIETCLELPWGKYSKETGNIEKSRKILEADHYGLEKVKERILEYLAVSTIAPEIRGQIICLVGPPGVGKTSVAKSIARATGRKYERIALGGVHDEAEIRGHRRTYLGSMPGRIVDALQKAGTSNPLILLDEVDKLSSDYKGDPTSALLEVLDPEQNSTFVDHYIDLPFDLSKVLFVTTANVRGNIPEPLQDRMEIIELGSYTFEEKFNIAKKHLIPKQIKRHGLKSSTLKITDKAVSLMIEGYTKEAGVRNLEQNIASVCRKSAMKIASGEKERITVKPEDLEALLGARKFRNDELSDENEIGVCNGLAWTSVGGEMLEIESAVLDGTGKLELTGSLGDVMQESAKTAVSYIRSKAKSLNIENDFYKTKDIHIHVPEGATPKDGPSAGVTIATSLASALMGKEIRRDVAMTGEITLRGRVLPIGGLKEKSMAAYRAGMKTVFIPYGNVADLDEVDGKVKENIKFVPVKNVETIWKNAIVDYTQEQSR